MSAENAPDIKFSDLGLPESLMQALRTVGYEVPSPIQAMTIPPLLAGRDLIGQAQTGTGKTAAFALPALAQLDLVAGKPRRSKNTPPTSWDSRCCRSMAVRPINRS